MECCFMLFHHLLQNKHKSMLWCYVALFCWILFRFTTNSRLILHLTMRTYHVTFKMSACMDPKRVKLDKDVKETIPVFIVDAFSKKPFHGNPAAVCLLTTEKNIQSSQMQAIAAEMNLSETAFIQTIPKHGDFITGDRFGLRWFTPTNEVPLCGHATVASAAVLFSEVGNKSEKITFETESGDLITRYQDGGIVMDFPLNTPIPQDISDYSSLLEILTSLENIQNVFYSPTTKKLLVRLKDSLSRDFLESLKPDIPAMVKVESSGKVKGVIVTLIGSPHKGCVDEDGRVYDFVSRYFAPWNGIPEDPVTGSAHTVLAPYWSEVLDKKQFYGRQCSKRGGDITMEIKGSSRVHLSGDAVIVMNGQLKV